MPRRRGGQPTPLGLGAHGPVGGTAGSTSPGARWSAVRRPARALFARGPRVGGRLSEDAAGMRVCARPVRRASASSTWPRSAGVWGGVGARLGSPTSHDIRGPERFSARRRALPTATAPRDAPGSRAACAASRSSARDGGWHPPPRGGRGLPELRAHDLGYEAPEMTRRGASASAGAP